MDGSCEKIIKLPVSDNVEKFFRGSLTRAFLRTAQIHGVITG
jgi:hypothetical protein